MSITFNLVPTTARASAVFVEQEAVNRDTGSAEIPHKMLAIGQFNTGKSPAVDAPQLILSKSDAWDRYGRGSMLATMVELMITHGGGVPVYALPVADAGAAAAATGTLDVTGTATASGTVAIYVGGTRVPIAVNIGQAAATIATNIAAAINANLDLPVTATAATGTVTLRVRWAGESGNQILLELNRRADEALPPGVGVAVTDIGEATAGANDPSLTNALANLGDTWFTEVALPYLSADAIGAMEAAGVARSEPGIKRMFVGFVGYTDTQANYLAFLGSRNSEWTTTVPVHGSATPAYVIAASTAAVFARRQQAQPGRPVKTLTLPGVIAGDTNGLTYDERNVVVLAGGSHTYNQEDGTVTIGDLCTTRTTDAVGAETEDWRFSIIIPNLQFKIFALEQRFSSRPFDRAVVLADGAGRGPTYAVRPSTVKGYAIGLVDDWVLRGLSTDRDTIVAGVVAQINGANPGRIDLLIPDVPSTGLRVLAAKVEWAFLVGGTN